MKTITKVLAIVMIAMTVTVSCTKDTETSEMDEANLTTSFEKRSEAELLLEAQAITQTRTPITYNGSVAIGATPVNFVGYDSQYYSFFGTAGDELIFHVRRLEAGLDPVATLYSGTGDTDNLIPIYGSDDGIDDDFDGCFGDPYFTVTLASTGDYTLRVWPFSFCSEDQDANAEVIITVVIPNSDDDGCDDNTDPYPNSIIGGNVTVQGCDSGAANIFIDDCTTMMDVLSACEENASSTEDYQDCAQAAALSWRRAGMLTGRQHYYLRGCISNTEIGEEISQ